MVKYCCRCGHVFTHEEAAIKKVRLYNIDVEEKVCPACKGSSYLNIEDMKNLHKIIEKSINKEQN